MAKQHGKRTVIKVGAADLSTYTNASELERTADSHDTTTYGNDAHRYNGGLLDGKFKMSGLYDNTAVSGPRAVLEPLLGVDGTVVTRQPEGTGVGKAQDVFSAVLNTYVESNPVADMVTWSAEWSVDGDVNSAPQ
jgi:hypothetical protein